MENLVHTPLDLLLVLHAGALQVVLRDPYGMLGIKSAICKASTLHYTIALAPGQEDASWWSCSRATVGREGQPRGPGKPTLKRGAMRALFSDSSRLKEKSTSASASRRR